LRGHLTQVAVRLTDATSRFMEREIGNVYRASPTIESKRMESLFMLCEEYRSGSFANEIKSKGKRTLVVATRSATVIDLD
jgi:hypothetical protein